MIEEWRSIVGYEGLYEVSNMGRVRSLNREVIGIDGKRYNLKRKIMKSYPESSGHLSIRLCKNGVSRIFKVHQLVLLSFVGPCPEGYISRHFPDRTPSNNRLDNLSWGTYSQNNGEDKVFHGTLPRGKASPTVKLTEENVLEIRKNGGNPYIISKKYGVSPSTIYHIYARRTWNHI